MSDLVSKANGNGSARGNETSSLPGESDSSARRLHRLNEARRREGVSRRTVAQQLGVSLSDVESQESETADLPLSILYQWQSVLNVPVTDLLVQPTDSLSAPVLKRARLVQLMKLAVTIAEQARDAASQRLGRRMVDQLMDIMPELRDVGSLPAIGQQRRPDECGRLAERTMPDQLLG